MCGKMAEINMENLSQISGDVAPPGDQIIQNGANLKPLVMEDSEASKISTFSDLSEDCSEMNGTVKSKNNLMNNSICDARDTENTVGRCFEESSSIKNCDKYLSNPSDQMKISSNNERPSKATVECGLQSGAVNIDSTDNHNADLRPDTSVLHSEPHVIESCDVLDIVKSSNTSDVRKSSSPDVPELNNSPVVTELSNALDVNVSGNVSNVGESANSVKHPQTISTPSSSESSNASVVSELSNALDDQEHLNSDLREISTFDPPNDTESTDHSTHTVDTSAANSHTFCNIEWSKVVTGSPCESQASDDLIIDESVDAADNSPVRIRTVNDSSSKEGSKASCSDKVVDTTRSASIMNSSNNDRNTDAVFEQSASAPQTFRTVTVSVQNQVSSTHSSATQTVISSADKDTDIQQVVGAEDLGNGEFQNSTETSPLKESDKQGDSFLMISEVFGGVTDNHLRELHSHGSVQTGSDLVNSKSPRLLEQMLKHVNKSGLAAAGHSNGPFAANAKIIDISPISEVQDGKSETTAIAVDDYEEKEHVIVIKEEKVDNNASEKIVKTKSNRKSSGAQANAHIAADQKVIIQNGGIVQSRTNQISPNIISSHSRFQKILQKPNVRLVNTQMRQTLVNTHAPQMRQTFPGYVNSTAGLLPTRTVRCTQPPQTSLLQSMTQIRASIPSTVVLTSPVQKMSRAGGSFPINVSAVPVLLGSNSILNTSQTQMLFALSSKSNNTMTTSNQLITIVPNMKAGVTSIPSVAGSSVISKMVVPKLAQIVTEAVECDYKRYKIMLDKSLKDKYLVDIQYLKYMSAQPTADLHLDGRFCKMFVCRGCDSMFLRQNSLSEHQLRRTLCLRYSCRATCHVLFYNSCQLVLHLRTHQPAADWEEKIEVTSLPDNLMGGDEDSDAYKEVKARIFQADKFGARLLKRKSKDNISITNSKSRKINTDFDDIENLGPSPLEKVMDGQNDDVEKILVDASPTDDTSNFVVDTSSDSKCILCIECGSKFATLEKLGEHMQGVSKAIISCKICPVVLHSNCALRAHNRIHRNSLPYVCPECGLIFHSTHKIFWRHLHVKCAHHLRQVAYTCTSTDCDESFKEKEQFINHIQTKHSITFYKCQLCPMAFKTNYNFKDHCNKRHAAVMSCRVIHKCPFCDAVYNDDKFISHIESHVDCSSLAKIVYRCNICEATFDKQRPCIHHLAAEHKFYFKFFEMCHICGAEFRSTAFLRSHQIKNHPNIKQLDLALTKSLRDSGILSNTRPDLQSESPVDDCTTNSISTTVIKEEPEGHVYSCHRCQTMFGDASTYQRHMARHRFIAKKRKLSKDPLPPPPPIQTEPSKTDVANDFILQIKLPKLDAPKVFTKQVPSAPDPEPQLHCPECDSSFFLEKHLNEHMKSEHNSRRLFPCLLCGQTYSDQEVLKSHIKQRHEGETKKQPYVCYVCSEHNVNRGFAMRKFLLKHLLKEHKIAKNQVDFSKMELYNKDNSSISSQKGDSSPGRSLDSTDDTESICGGKEALLTVKRLKQDGDSEFACAKCAFRTSDRKVFVSHIEKHRPSKLQGLKQCFECGLMFTVMPSLKNHLFLVHKIRDFAKYSTEYGLVESNTECFDLPVKTANPQPDRISRPRGFSETKTTPQKRSLPDVDNSEGNECNVCYKSYDSEAELRAHMRTHGMAFIRSKRMETP